MKHLPKLTPQPSKISFRWISIANLLVLAIAALIIPAAPSLGATSIGGTPPKLPRLSRPKGTRQAHGGARGQCHKVATPLTAFVPLTEAQTIAQHPTFWFYSPYITDGNLTAQFKLNLEKEERRELPPVLVTLPATPGLIGVQLPKNIDLKVNTSYQWFLVVNCDISTKDTNSGASPGPIEIEGTVRRVVRLPIAPQPLASPREQVAFYTTNDLWLDAVNTLLEKRLKASKETTLDPEWQMVLESLDLKEFAAIPVVP
jgi:hypothetical protein